MQQACSVMIKHRQPVATESTMNVVAVERPQNEVKVAAGKTEFGMFNVALGTNVALIPLWPLPSFPYPAPHLAHIAEPVTEIHGGADLFINKGSTINLTCVVKYAPEPPPSVTWSHNRQVTN